MTWKLKGCPRCGGDVFLDRDYDGWFEECLQCGRRFELENIYSSKNPALERKEVEAASGKGNK